MKNNCIEMPTYEEREKFGKTYNDGLDDDSREYASESYERQELQKNSNNTTAFVYIYYKPGPKFTYDGNSLHGSDSIDRKNIQSIEGGLADMKRPRYIVHTHNYNTNKVFGDDKPRIKPPSTPDKRVVKKYIAGIVFDTENETVYIYTDKKSVIMSKYNFFKKFPNE